MEKTPALTIAKYKSFPTSDGGAFSCDVLIDGKLAFHVTNGGYGGPDEIDWSPSGGDKSPVKARVLAWVATLPPIVFYNKPCSMTLDVVVGDAINTMVTARTLKRACAKKTLFRLPTDKPGEWRVIAAPFSDQVRAVVTAGYPGVQVQFANAP